MTARVRLSDIAGEAGVSITTVARVLSGNGRNVRVSVERAETIRRIADRLNYRPNISARTLAGQASKVLGVLIDSQAPATRFRTVGEIEREASKHGYRVMIGEVHDSTESLRESYHILCQHGVDGVIVLSHEYSGAMPSLDDCFPAGARIVFIDPPVLANASFVKVDRANGVEQAVVRLHQLGRRRIGLLTDRADLEAIRQRIAGYEGGLAAAGGNLPRLIRRIAIDFNPRQIRLTAHSVVREFVQQEALDALIAHNDLYAAALTSELQAAGVRVPEDVAIVGHDNETFTECVTPQLSSIDEASEKVAAHAVRMLLEMFQDSEDVPIARQLSVKTKLMERDSMR